MTTSDAAPTAEPLPQVVVGVRFREAARIYHYSAEPDLLFPGEYVVVETSRGEEMARVVTVPDADETEPAPAPRGVRPILRQATRDDRDRAAAGRQRADQMLEQMRQVSARDGLGLYPIAVQLNLDGSQATGFFQAPDHVDFRVVVREVEAEHNVRLHMQLAGPRDRAKLVDGYDICGLRLCCASWMTSFPKVGIRTAKDQDLSLNPDSISGVCGRLLCCLTFEHEVYREMRGTMPKVGKRVTTPAGMGRVVKLNVLQQYITISLDDVHQRVDVPVAEIGLAVRTEDAPNQALIDDEREREQREQLRQAAAPAEAAAPSDIPTATELSDAAAAPESHTPESAAAEPARSPRRRRRRRRTVDSNSPTRPNIEQSPRASRGGPQSGAPGGATEPPRRRRRNRRRRSRGRRDDGPPNQSPDQNPRTDSE